MQDSHDGMMIAFLMCMVWVTFNTVHLMLETDVFNIHKQRQSKTEVRSYVDVSVMRIGQHWLFSTSFTASRYVVSQENTAVVTADSPASNEQLIHIFKHLYSSS